MAEETYKKVEIDGEEFVIQKFSAITGLQILRFVLAKLSPVLPEIKDGAENEAMSIVAMTEALGLIKDDELQSFVMRCLKHCFKSYPAGLQAVVDKTGNFGVDGVEYDILKTAKLCIEACKWGISDFFTGKNSDLLRRAAQSTGLSLNL